MKASLGTIKDHLAKHLQRAEELSGSNNEDTASKYEEVASSLQEAIDSIANAIMLLNTYQS